MFRLLLAVFTWFMAPVPWIISAIHILVAKKYWHFITAKISLAIIAALIWLGIGYWFYQNYQSIFASELSNFIGRLFGAIILLLALTIELLTTKALGLKMVFGSSELKQTKDKLITTGIYRYARHPRYVEHPMWFLGFGLLFGYTFFLWFSLYLFIAFIITAYFEERELIKRYGREYLEYKKKVPAFFAV